MNYKRILLKISGEALMGDQSFGIDPAMADRLACDMREAVDLGVRLSIVVGGGNIFRGVSGASQGMDRVTADHIGMLATVTNSLTLQNALQKQGLDCKVLSAIRMDTICEPYVKRTAIEYVNKGQVVIFAAGTGDPYFTTDTAAALRALEMGCDAILKATKVDGVYDKDPVVHNDALRYDWLSYQDVLAKNLRVMDGTAISLAQENNIPIVVLSLKQPGNIARVLQSKGTHTTISQKETK
jgi:uridylate kinase